MEDFNILNSLQALSDSLLQYAPKIVGAIIILIIGFWIVGWVLRLLDRWMKRSKQEPELKTFLRSIVGVLLKVLVFLTAAGIVGVNITAFAALLAAAGLAVGMALQGTLGHFAAGVMILIFKPYRVGDLVDIQGVVGHVKEIQIFNTIIDSLDSRKVIMPNGIATSGIMTNLTANGKLRVDLNVAFTYEEDFEKIKGIISNALNKVTERLPDEPTIEIEKFDEHNVLLAVRPYATDETYWDVYFNSYKEIKAAFAQAGIEVAYPVRKIKNI